MAPICVCHLSMSGYVGGMANPPAFALDLTL